MPRRNGRDRSWQHQPGAHWTLGRDGPKVKSSHIDIPPPPPAAAVRRRPIEGGPMSSKPPADPVERIRAVRDEIRAQTSKLPRVDSNGYPVKSEEDQ